MDNPKPLFIPPSKKVRGLKIHCYRCGTTVATVCKSDNVPIKQCKFGSEHTYKVFAHVPGTKKGRKTRTLTDVRDLDEARRLALEFQQEIKDGVQSAPVTKVPIQSIVRVTSTPASIPAPADQRLLVELMARYIGYLHGEPEIVPAFKRKTRSKQHIADVKRTFLRFAVSTKENDRKLETMSANDINDEIIGEFHEYLIDDLDLGNAGYNRALTNMTSFYEYLIDEGFATRNPFTEVVRKSLGASVDTIYKEQFDALVEIVQKPEYGIRVLSNDVKKNYYKPWMRDAIELGLYSGRRREEIVMMKWKDVDFESGVPQSIRVPDYKVIRQKGLVHEKDWIYHYVPVTRELQTLLERLGESGSEADEYILAPEEKMSRESMRALMSKAFSHYYSQLGYDNQLKFGCLRTTYFTKLSAAMGMENAQAVSGHSGTQVMKKHYINKKILAKTAKEFNVFGVAPSEGEINNVREKRKSNDRKKGKDNSRSV